MEILYQNAFLGFYKSCLVTKELHSRFKILFLATELLSVRVQSQLYNRKVSKVRPDFFISILIVGSLCRFIPIMVDFCSYMYIYIYIYFYPGTSSFNPLTHWGGVTHICVGKLTTISSDNGLSPGRRPAIIWTIAGILLIGHPWEQTSVKF